MNLLQIVSVLLLIIVTAVVTFWLMYFLVKKDFFLRELFRTIRYLLQHYLVLLTLIGIVVAGLLVTSRPLLPEKTLSPAEIWEIWNHMGFTAKAVNVVLLLMSFYSLAVMIHRYVIYERGKRESWAYAPKVAKLLRDGKIQEAIKISSAKEVKNSHLARVLLAGLQEYELQKESAGGRSRDDVMEAAHRAIERATALNLSDLKRGLSGLATLGGTAAFLGLFGTVGGIINAFRGMALTGSGGISAVSAGIAEALVATAFGLFVAIPAVWAFNYLTTRVESFSVEMDNSASELVAHMLKRTASA